MNGGEGSLFALHEHNVGWDGHQEISASLLRARPECQLPWPSLQTTITNTVDEGRVAKKNGRWVGHNYALCCGDGRVACFFSMEGWQEVPLADSNKVVGARAGLRQFSLNEATTLIQDEQRAIFGTLAISAASRVANPKFHQRRGI
jgi:hypothetical protein